MIYKTGQMKQSCSYFLKFVVEETNYNKEQN